MKKLKRLLSKKSSKAPPSAALSTLEKLHETLEMLEKKEHLIQKKISAEIEKAKDHTKSKNKSAAIQCLKKKRLYESQIEQLGNFQLRVHDQVILLEGAKATTDTVDAMRSGAAAVKLIQQSLSVDEIDKTMEELTEYSENMKQIQDTLATPLGAAADLDEDELEAELDELEEIDNLEEMEKLEQLPRVTPAQTPSSEKLPSKPASQPKSDVEELATHQAEMAI